MLCHSEYWPSAVIEMGRLSRPSTVDHIEGIAACGCEPTHHRSKQRIELPQERGETLGGDAEDNSKGA